MTRVLHATLLRRKMRVRALHRIGSCGSSGLLAGVLLLAACAGDRDAPRPGAGSASSPSVRGYKVGSPYQIKGIWYYPRVDYEYSESGIASWYGPGFHGRSTANGEVYDMNDLTAAHRTLPLPSVVRVTNLENGRSLSLRVNDRGPFYGDRIIDVSRRAAQMLGFYQAGTAHVQVQIMPEESRALAVALGVPDTGPLGVGVASAQAAPANPVPTVPASEPVTSARVEPAIVEPADGELVAVTPAAVEAPTYVASASTLTSTAAASDFGSTPSATGGTAGAAQESLYEVSTVQPPLYAARPAAGEKADAGILYVQAGAFADAGRADRARRRLAPIGPVVMSPSKIHGRELLRVRVGPLRTDSEAERVLASVSHAGFPDCQLIVE
jgi:rare lipoprotein A